MFVNTHVSSIKPLNLVYCSARDHSMTWRDNKYFQMVFMNLEPMLGQYQLVC